MCFYAILVFKLIIPTGKIDIKQDDVKNKRKRSNLGHFQLLFELGLNEIYVWFLLPTYPKFFNPTLNIKMVFGEKIPKMGTFSDFVSVFFVKCYNKI